MNNHIDNQASVGFGLLGSIFWSGTDDKCKRINNTRARSNSMHHGSDLGNITGQPYKPIGKNKDLMKRESTFYHQDCKKPQEEELNKTSLVDVHEQMCALPPVASIEFKTPSPETSSPSINFSPEYQHKETCKTPLSSATKTGPCLPKTTSHQRRTSTATCTSHATYLHHLDIGDLGTPLDMDKEASIPSKIDDLQVHDFAFILRSDGSWTYAIIADKKENSILFVVDTSGGTKVLSRKHWNTSIQLVKNETKTKSTMLPRKSPSLVSSLKDEKHFKDSKSLPPPPLVRKSKSVESVPREVVRKLPPPPPFHRSRSVEDIPQGYLPPLREDLISSSLRSSGVLSLFEFEDLGLDGIDI